MFVLLILLVNLLDKILISFAKISHCLLIYLDVSERTGPLITRSRAAKVEVNFVGRAHEYDPVIVFRIDVFVGPGLGRSRIREAGMRSDNRP